MNARVRLGLFLVFAAAAAVFVLWGTAGLPKLGHYRGPYGDIVNRVAIPERHTTSAVTPIVFDYRGFDTLGEEFILFAAVLGATLLLRTQSQEREVEPEEALQTPLVESAGDAGRLFTVALILPTTLFGIYVAVHGHLTPGGGFQAGAVLAASPVLVYLAGEVITFRQLSPLTVLDFGEGAGAGGFAAIGFLGILAGGAYLENVLPLGRVGSVFSGGTLPVLNLAVAVAVAGGTVLIVYEFFGQLLKTAPRERRTRRRRRFGRRRGGGGR